MPVVNPGIRRFLGSAIQRLLNGAAFALPLTHTAIPERGDITPSFTRATTATGQKWDEAGYLNFTALAGEAVFKGARRVRNLIVTTSEDFSNAAWTKSVCSVTSSTESGPLGSTNATLITLGGGTTNKAIVYSATASAPAIPSFYFKAGTHKYVQLMNASDTEVFANFDLDLGVVGTKGTKATSSIEDVGDGWYRVSALYNSTAILGTSWRVYFVSSASAVYAAATASTGTVYIWGAQLEDVTGQADQTASEYVSVGVESAPAYHGAFVDGVLYSDLDRSGNPISTSGSYPLVGYVPWEARTNLCLQSNAFTTAPWAQVGVPTVTQNVTGPDGAANSAWTLTDDSALIEEQIYQPYTLTAAAYTFSVFVKKTSGAQSSYPVLFAQQTAPVSIVSAAVTIDTSNGVATAWTAYTGFTSCSCTATCTDFNADFWRVTMTFTGTASSWFVQLMPAATTNATQSTGITDVAVQGSAVFYGAQVELGSFATPYIPTTTLAVARSADLLTYTGADVANIKTLACTFSRGVGVSNNGYAVALSDGTTNNYISMSAPSATQARFLGVTGGVTQWDTIPAYTAGVTSKVSQSFATNDIKMDKDGTAQTADTAATVPVVTQLNVGHIAGGFVLNGPVNHIYGWTRNLSQSELGAIDR